MASAKLSRRVERTVKRARSRADEHWIDREIRQVEIAAREEEERDAVILAGAREPQLELVTPGEVMTEPDWERWGLAVAVAHERVPHLGASHLWEMARRLYASIDLASLRAAAAELPPRESPRPSRAEEFRRRPQLELSRSMGDRPL